MEADWQTIENKLNITPIFDSLNQKIKTEAPESDSELISKIKIENAILDEIEFKNCNVKEEITEEFDQEREDPLKVYKGDKKEKEITIVKNAIKYFQIKFICRLMLPKFMKD